MMLTPHFYTGDKEQLNMQSNTALLALKEHLNSHANKTQLFLAPKSGYLVCQPKLLGFFALFCFLKSYEQNSLCFPLVF